MDGQEVFRFAIKNARRAPRSSALKAERAHEPATRLGRRAPGEPAHHPQVVTTRLGFPLEKFILNIEEYGNTSSASLPTTLDEANRAGRLKKGDLIGMLAIGAGMAWGSAVVRW